MSNLIGQSLGRYHILEQLGEGGMATVYKAYDTRLETDVAVKVIRTESLPQNAVERSLKRFEREAKALARLTHPNIVKVTDYGEYEGKPYLVMPYLPGGTLKQKLNGKPMPWQEAIHILLPIARALAYAHEQGMVHRDVKPSNILITHSGDPMLTDFGIAKMLDLEETMDLTGTNAAVGTPEYMAPEQVTSKTVDHRADIYGLGVVLYEMVTGRKPFQADTPMAVLFKHASEPLPRPSAIAPNLPQSVENVLLKSLAKKPEDRYQSMGEFEKAMERLLDGKTKSTPEARRPGDSGVNNLKTSSRPRTEKMPPRSAPEPGHSRTIWRSWMLWIGGIALVAVAILFIFHPSTPTPEPTFPAVPATQVQPTQVSAAGPVAILDSLITACKAEGMITIIATPTSWANYGDIFTLFETTSGVKINSINEDAGSADELAAIEANKDNKGPQAPDIVDVGYAFGATGKTAGDYQAYKVSTWDKIPDAILGIPSKDPDGFWTGGYYGVMALGVNTAVVKTPPTNWADLLKPDYKDQVALAGDPRSSNQAILAVFAAALGNGGSLDNAQPGLNFFKKLNDAGNFVPKIAQPGTVAQGATPIFLTWDYLALGDRDAFAGNPPIKVVYPSPTIASMYVQAISAYAPHPNCAKLWMEILHSDSGQLAWMKGYAHGVNQSDMEARGVIPANLTVMLPTSSAYASAVSPTPDQVATAKSLIIAGWYTTVGVNIK